MKDLGHGSRALLRSDSALATNPAAAADSIDAKCLASVTSMSNSLKGFENMTSADPPITTRM